MPKKSKKTIKQNPISIFFNVLAMVLLVIAVGLIAIKPDHLSLMIAIFIIIMAFLIMSLAISKTHKKEIDYRAIFTLGLVWTAVGLPFRNYSLLIMGLIFICIGLAKKNKWKRRIWSDMSTEEKKLKLAMIFFLGLAGLSGLIIYLIAG